MLMKAHLKLWFVLMMNEELNIYSLNSPGINQETCFNQKPVVVTGQKLKKGDIIADGPGIEKGELALAVTFLLHSCRVRL